MTDDLNNMEAEVDAMLASLSGQLTVGSDPAATERAKSAVRHELNEIWLAHQATPTPSADTLRRVRETIDQELKKRAPYTWVRPRIWAPLAAAALIAICVGLIHYARISQTSQPATVDLDIFAQALEATFEENPFTLAANMDLDNIEDSINNLAAGTNNEYEILDDIGNQIDELFMEPDWLETSSTGVIG